MSRFFIGETDQIDQNTICLRGENFHHLAKVLRARIGEQIEVCDGEGTDYFCTCESFDKESACLRIDRSAPSRAENGPHITLYQCLAKGEKMEQLITRCVEMGVWRIVPVLSRFCVARPEQAEKKRERWQKIARSAAEQSGRGLIPRVEDVISIDEAIERMTHAPMSFVCYEKEENRTLADLSVAEEISFLIGSEGGLADEECAQWQRLGIPSVSLGERILRTENAAAYVLPVLFYKSKTEVTANEK